MRSLFLQTELLFWKHHSQIEEIDGGWIVRTPDNRTWNWGNLLILKEAPVAEDAAHWLDVFHTRIRRADRGTIITWDQGEVSPDAIAVFDALGLTMSTGSILTLRDLKQPEHYDPRVNVTEAGSDDALWERAVQIDIDAFSAGFGGPAYEAYARKRFDHHRTLVEKGIGTWYLASMEGEFVGNLGIFPGDGFCRFQEISVLRESWRQGIASTMTYEVARRAREVWPTQTQVIVADSDGNAQRIYRALGFEEHSISQALQMKPKNELSRVNA